MPHCYKKLRAIRDHHTAATADDQPVSVDRSSVGMELVDNFCYLCDMLSVHRDADAAVETRKGNGWNKCRQLVALLSSQQFPI